MKFTTVSDFLLSHRWLILVEEYPPLNRQLVQRRPDLLELIHWQYLTILFFLLQEQGECSTSGRPLEGLNIPTRGMARGLGSVGGATLQRSKLDLAKEVKTVDPKVDDGAGGGNNGKNIFNGGGGDNDGGDDDDYFDNFDGGDGDGDDGSFFRTVIAQLYDRKSINAVLQEWFRTLESLPAILRGSVEMGLFSSAQLVRFLSMDVRPNVARAVTRSLPPQVRLIKA